MKVDAQNRTHFKIVFWGCSLSGKTTCLKWIYSKVFGIKKGEFTSIQDPTGRTLYFDYTPFSATGQVIFDVYTVAGQKRHVHQRRIILSGADGILFVVDSQTYQRQANIESLDELKRLLGEKLGEEIPMIVLINKRDLPDLMPIEEIKKMFMGIKTTFYETVATKGDGLRRSFYAVSRSILLKRLYQIENKPESASQAEESVVSK